MSAERAYSHSAGIRLSSRWLTWIRSTHGVRLDDRLITGLLLGACLIASTVHMAPRMTVREAPLSVLQPEIVISVMGEVASPGTYSLPFGSRVADAVAAAGGMLPSAAVQLVPAAAVLSDGQGVMVPGLMAVGGTTARVSLNSAAPEQLESLPGIGPVIAARIVANRPYARVDDLLRVPGIGPRTLERLEPLVAM